MPTAQRVITNGRLTKNTLLYRYKIEALIANIAKLYMTSAAISIYDLSSENSENSRIPEQISRDLSRG